MEKIIKVFYVEYNKLKVYMLVMYICRKSYTYIHTKKCIKHKLFYINIYTFKLYIKFNAAKKINSQAI